MAVEVHGIKSDRTPREQRVVALAASAAPSPRRSEGMRLSVWQCGQGTVQIAPSIGASWLLSSLKSLRIDAVVIPSSA
jgi:hypothetical protein